MYRTLDVDKAMSDVTQGATTIEDLALSDFLSMTYSETIADSTMLIAGAKQLQSNEWESLKLDYLTMRANPDQYKSTSTDVHLSHNTTFFTKPLISFLDQYRQSPESYPEFSQMTANLNSSAVAMTLLYHQVQIDAGTSMSQLLTNNENDLYSFSMSTEAAYSESVSSLLGSQTHRLELSDATDLAKQIASNNQQLEAKVDHYQESLITPDSKYALSPM